MGQKFKYKFDWINYYYLNNNKLYLFKFYSSSFSPVISSYVNIKMF